MPRIHSLLLTSLLSSAALIGSSAAQTADTANRNTAGVGTVTTTVTESTRRTALPALTNAESRNTAINFINYVDTARYYLAAKDTVTARRHIDAAKEMARRLSAYTVEQRRIYDVPTGRIAYDSQSQYNVHYYPVEAGTVTLKDVDTGPFWSRDKGIAIKDAEVVYLSVDLNKTDVNQRLTEALDNIGRNRTDQADTILANLVDDVVEVADERGAPGIKARDNMELANHYLLAKQYDAARYPLRHAKEALEDMRGDEKYAAQRVRIDEMIADIDGMQNTIARRDPNALERAQQNVQAWWGNLQGWVQERTT